MRYLSNAFSLQMVDGDYCAQVEDVRPSEVPETCVSIIGHADTAAVVSSILHRDVLCNRQSVKLDIGDALYVAQVTGGRLPEGATTLPEGFKIRFKRVEIIPY